MALPRLLVICCLAGLALGSMDTMLADGIDRCVGSAAGTEACLRLHLTKYLGAPRAAASGEGLFDEVLRLARTHEFRLQLPQALHSATLVFKPGRGIDFDVEFPHENDVTPTEDGRDMKKNMMFPLLMMMKMKMKMLTPLILAHLTLKTTKALILSKIAILLVLGFIIVQVCQKLGMAKMSMAPAMPPMEPTPPPSMYGPPTSSSYDPSGWEPAPGPYARVDSQQLAYSAYTTQPPLNKYKKM